MDRPRSASEAASVSAGACGGRRTVYQLWLHRARPRPTKRSRGCRRGAAPPRRTRRSKRRGGWPFLVASRGCCRCARPAAAVRVPWPAPRSGDALPWAAARAGSGGAGARWLSRAPRGALGLRVWRGWARATRRCGCKAAAAVPARWRNRRRGQVCLLVVKTAGSARNWDTIFRPGVCVLVFPPAAIPFPSSQHIPHHYL